MTLEFVFSNCVFNAHAHKDNDHIENKIKEFSRELLHDETHVCLESKNLYKSRKDDEDAKLILKKVLLTLF